MFVWRSEDKSWELVLSFHYGGADGSQVSKLYPLSHIGCPLALVFILLLLSDVTGLLLRHLPQASLLQTLLWANHSVPSPFPVLWSPPSTSSSVQIQAPLNYTLSCFLCIPAKSESRSPNRAVWQQREKPVFLQNASGESHIPYFCLGPSSNRRLSHRYFEILQFCSARLMCTLSWVVGSFCLPLNPHFWGPH